MALLGLCMLSGGLLIGNLWDPQLCMPMVAASQVQPALAWESLRKLSTCELEAAGLHQ